MVDDGATSGAYSPLSEVMQQALSVCYFCPVEHSLFWTWSHPPELMEMLPGVVHLREASSELHRKVICSYIRSKMQRKWTTCLPSAPVWPLPQQGRSKACMWLGIYWTVIKAEMIVLRSFIVPSGREVKASDWQPQNLASEVGWSKSELLYQPVYEITVCCCGPLTVMCEWTRWVVMLKASQTQMSSKMPTFLQLNMLKKVIYIKIKSRTCMCNCTHFRAGIHIAAFRNIFDLETLIWPTSRSAFQMFRACFGACVCVFVRVCMQIIHYALILSRWSQWMPQNE